MKKLRLFGLFCALTVNFVACGHKQDATGALEKAAKAMEETPVTTPAPAPAAQPTPAVEAPAQAAPAPPPAQELKQALASYKAGQMEDAVTRLHNLRSQTSMTPAQKMALQDTIAAVTTEIYGLAAKGDTRAIAAVKQWEQMQTNSH